MKKLFTIVIIFIFTINLIAQGCGDAGACSINFMKATHLDNSDYTIKNKLKVGNTFGLAQYKVLVISQYLEYSRFFNPRISTSIKLTSSLHYGDITTTSGFSDIYVSAKYNIGSKLNIIGGIKLPFNKSDKTKNNIMLPMSYQTSLGTTDLISGISFLNKNFMFLLAYQKPITQNNNTFFISDYPIGTIDTNYQSTNGYYRQDDILLRVSYTHNLKNNKWILIYSILPIYHTRNDTYTTELDKVEEINNSKGLTLNLNIFLQYKISELEIIEVSVAAPIISRKARPDGLISMSLGVEYSFSF